MMISLLDISRKYKTLSFVGMAKNAGKTTALNFLIEEAMDEGLKIGVTSTGRDGETEDLVTGTEKPKVYLDSGTIVSVPELLYDLSDAGLEVIRRTEYSSAIGALLICKVMEAGYVQVAGPVINAQQKLLCDEMISLGCDMVLIDGAIDRKTIASPDTSEAIVLATGAVLSRKMDKVIEDTVHVVNTYNTDEIENDDIVNIVNKEEFSDKILLLNESLNVTPLVLSTGLGKEAAIKLSQSIKEDTKYVFIPGAFTTSAISALSTDRLKQVSFIVKDPTKIFINPMDLKVYKKRGFKVNVLKKISIAAITVNPWSPLGYTFDNIQLAQSMQDAIPDIPIIDVRM